MDTIPFTPEKLPKIKQTKVTRFLKKIVKIIGFTGVAIAFVVLWALLGGKRFGCTTPENGKE